MSAECVLSSNEGNFSPLPNLEIKKSMISSPSHVKCAEISAKRLVSDADKCTYVNQLAVSLENYLEDSCDLSNEHKKDSEDKLHLNCTPLRKTTDGELDSNLLHLDQMSAGSLARPLLGFRTFKDTDRVYDELGGYKRHSSIPIYSVGNLSVRCDSLDAHGNNDKTLSSVVQKESINGSMLNLYLFDTDSSDVISIQPSDCYGDGFWETSSHNDKHVEATDSKQEKKAKKGFKKGFLKAVRTVFKPNKLFKKDNAGSSKGPVHDTSFNNPNFSISAGQSIRIPGVFGVVQKSIMDTSSYQLSSLDHPDLLQGELSESAHSLVDKSLIESTLPTIIQFDSPLKPVMMRFSGKDSYALRNKRICDARNIMEFFEGIEPNVEEESLEQGDTSLKSIISGNYEVTIGSYSGDCLDEAVEEALVATNKLSDNVALVKVTEPKGSSDTVGLSRVPSLVSLAVRIVSESNKCDSSGQDLLQKDPSTVGEIKKSPIETGLFRNDIFKELLENEESGVATQKPPTPSSSDAPPEEFKVPKGFFKKLNLEFHEMAMKWFRERRRKGTRALKYPISASSGDVSSSIASINPSTIQTIEQEKLSVGDVLKDDSEATSLVVVSEKTDHQSIKNSTSSESSPSLDQDLSTNNNGDLNDLGCSEMAFH